MISNVVIDLGTVDLLFMQKYIWVVKDSIVHTNGPALNKLCSCEGKTLPTRKFLSKEKSSSYLMVGKTWMKCQSSTPMAVLIWNSLSLICDADSFSIRPCLALCNWPVQICSTVLLAIVLTKTTKCCCKFHNILKPKNYFKATLFVLVPPYCGSVINQPKLNRQQEEEIEIQVLYWC